MHNNEEAFTEFINIPYRLKVHFLHYGIINQLSRLVNLVNIGRTKNNNHKGQFHDCAPMVPFPIKCNYCAVHCISNMDKENVSWFEPEWTVISGIILPSENKRKPTLA